MSLTSISKRLSLDDPQQSKFKTDSGEDVVTCVFVIILNWVSFGFLIDITGHICISSNPRFHSVSEMGKGISAAVVVVDESDGTAPENPYD